MSVEVVAVSVSRAIQFRSLQPERGSARRGGGAARRPHRRPRAARPRTRGSSPASRSLSSRTRTRLLSTSDWSVSRSASQTSSADSRVQPPGRPRGGRTALLLLGEQVVAPLDRRPQRLLAWVDAAAGLEQVEPLPEPLEELLGGGNSDTCRRQLERERELSSRAAAAPAAGLSAAVRAGMRAAGVRVVASWARGRHG